MYIMRSNNKSIYSRIRAVFLCFKQSSYIRITILILSTYFYLFASSDHLYFFLMFLFDYFKYQKSKIFMFYKYLFTTIYLLLYI